jgi:CheY-like chemotaxis protein
VARILIIEDHLKDLRIAEETACDAGYSDIAMRTDVPAATRYLETAADGGVPDVILLDLDLGAQSGYEMLRIRYETAHLGTIPIVVWTHLGEENCEVCALFNITGYVSKWEGATALREMLAKLRTDLDIK